MRKGMNTAPANIRTFDAFKASSYFNSLDGLRAISIFLVLLHHVPRFRSSLIQTLQENGRYGVSLFFVISGFLICTLLLREEEKTGRLDLWKFYGRRALRLLPLYYLALLLQAFLVFGFQQYSPENRALFAEKLPAYLFYYSNWLTTATQGPFLQAWSLAVEEQFYVAFGLLLVFARRRLVIQATLAALFVKFAVYQTLGTVDTGSTLWRVVFSYREPILFGVLAAFTLNLRRGYEFFLPWLGSARSLPCLTLVTGAWLGVHPMQQESLWDAQLLYLLMTLTMMGLVFRPATPVISGRFATHVGRTSYGTYLLHLFVMSAVKKLPGGSSPALCLSASAIAAVLIASLVHKCLEQPIIAFYKKKLSPLNSTLPEPLAQAADDAPVILPQCRIS
jgi:peptidoglycan/LPS O-acetylase OafA/YrhL